MKDAEQAGADRIHCDVMDGHFVPNITFGPLVVEAVKKCVSVPLDVHLMISDPGAYVDAFCNAGADVLTFHAEADCVLTEVIEAIAAHKVRVGVTVNPDKPVELFIDHLERIDQVLIMTVYAGFGGQKFIPETMAKAKAVYDRAARIGHPVDIQVDGGVNHETAGICAANGANVLVAGSYIFGSDNYRAKIEAIRQPALGNALP